MADQIRKAEEANAAEKVAHGEGWNLEWPPKPLWPENTARRKPNYTGVTRIKYLRFGCKRVANIPPWGMCSNDTVG